MAKVLLYSTSLEFRDGDAWEKGAYKLFLESARNCRFGRHTLTGDPDEADVILFAELGGGYGLFAELVRHHPFYKRYRDKCFLFDASDYALPLVPGVYASLRQRYYDPARTRTGYYLRTDENPYIDPRPLPEEPTYLGCFIGTFSNHPVRSYLGKLPANEFLVEDMGKISLKALVGEPGVDRNRFWSHYADGMAASAFSLCPRGLGPGSVRLFESMRMGRCPVILADEWVFPQRVDWTACSLIVAEKDAGRLPEILRSNRHRAAELGQRARQEWERYYAPDVRFHWLVEDCVEMRAARRLPEAIAGRLAWRHLLRRGNLRRYLTSKKAMYRRHGRILL